MIVIAGTLTIDADRIDEFKPHLADLAAATRGEDGCEAYTFAQDVLEPAQLRIFEMWRDQAALDSHMTAPHMAKFMEVSGSLGIIQGMELNQYKAEPAG